MTSLEALRQKLHAAIDAETSEARLREIAGVLDHALPQVTEAQEASIGRGIADIEAGRVVSYEEFKKIGEAQAAERRAKYGQK